MPAIGRIGWVLIDTSDPEALAAFWREVLDVGVHEEIGTSPAGPQYIILEPTEAGAPKIGFQWVPESKVAKNRVHLDIPVDDVDKASEIVVSLGGSVEGAYEEDGYRWRVMLDPHGNEFCLVPHDQES
jgi:predicted enzyme related to lactoylglutathione lyase